MLLNISIKEIEMYTVGYCKKPFTSVSCVLIQKISIFLETTEMLYIAEYFYKIEIICISLRTARIPLTPISYDVEYFSNTNRNSYGWLLQEYR